MKILLLLLLYLLKRCLARTAADEFNELQYGSGKVDNIKIIFHYYYYYYYYYYY